MKGEQPAHRERYGLPAVGNDNLGYDFKVPNPEGLLFGISTASFLIEVKSTITDGTGSFLMSSKEWKVARQCHENKGDNVYVIVRMSKPSSFHASATY
ncbi:DUF3883 domain-containing protein [Nitrosomonas sp. Is37]|uniref:DUF3883 domain-containing protein n=1 Tax=Nitrosomonas sp. Is37 TaxID=3080535 RepID=UPI003982A3B6